jgi:hypothetical protein
VAKRKITRLSDVLIEAVPYREQRSDTAGDWYKASDAQWRIRQDEALSCRVSLRDARADRVVSLNRRVNEPRRVHSGHDWDQVHAEPGQAQAGIRKPGAFVSGHQEACLQTARQVMLPMPAVGPRRDRSVNLSCHRNARWLVAGAGFEPAALGLGA